jgi:hypothetical protein
MSCVTASQITSCIVLLPPLCRVMIDQYQSLLSQAHAEKDLLQLESKRKWESVEGTLREHELLKSKCSKMNIQVTKRAHYFSIASAHMK